MTHRTLGSVVQTVVCCICMFMIAACDNAPGPPKLDGSKVKSTEGDVRSQNIPSSAQKNIDQPDRSLSERSRLRIDSVPRGAEVSYQPGGTDSKASSTPIGKTPLELDSRQYPSGTFVIMMRMDTYLAAISGVPALEVWIKQFNSQNTLFGYNYDGNSELFQFDTPTTRQVLDANRKLIAVGPVYTLDSSTSDRVCALFIPRGTNVRDFFPLMPADGTYDLDKDAYGRSLIVNYGFDISRAREAVESLARCGKYVTTVDVFKPTGRRSMVVLSAQRGKYLTSAYAP